ncbi:hypothetical protein BS78_03G249100 [Paspalum vaginatum]|nr:hypothetical protein BS78_03G249100 [Paspalum vaginatum]
MFDRFYRVLGEKIDTLLSGITVKPLAISDEDKAVQEKFKETANKCIELVVDVTRRVRPVEKKRRLFLMMGEVYPLFASVRWFAKAGRANWRMALQIIEKLEVLRKMVSSACGTPLPVPVNREQMVFDRKVALTPLDTDALAGHGIESNLSVENPAPFPFLF